MATALKYHFLFLFTTFSINTHQLSLSLSLSLSLPHLPYCSFFINVYLLELTQLLCLRNRSCDPAAFSLSHSLEHSHTPPFKSTPSFNVDVVVVVVVVVIVCRVFIFFHLNCCPRLVQYRIEGDAGGKEKRKEIMIALEEF